MTSNPKYAEKIDLLNPDNTLAGDLKEIIRAKAADPLIVCKAL